MIENNTTPARNDADRETIKIEEQRKLIADFLEVQPDAVAFNWDIVHRVLQKLRGINYGFAALNEQKQKHLEQLMIDVAHGQLNNCFDVIDVAADWHLKLFKKSTLKNGKD